MSGLVRLLINERVPQGRIWLRTKLGWAEAPSELIREMGVDTSCVLSIDAELRVTDQVAAMLEAQAEQLTPETSVRNRTCCRGD
jgi:hypothetical protein